jgi:starvation-inducible outer membrane lipoprotein
MRSTAFSIPAALLLAACTTLPGGIDYTKMTAEQIKAIGSDKSISAACTTANSVYGRVVTVTMTVDRGTVVNGGVTVDDACKIDVRNTTPPPPSVVKAGPGPEIFK